MIIISYIQAKITSLSYSTADPDQARSIQNKCIPQKYPCMLFNNLLEVSFLRIKLEDNNLNDQHALAFL